MFFQLNLIWKELVC